MKTRVAVRSKKTKPATRQTHEEQAMRNVFIEDEASPDSTTGSFADLNLEAPEDKSDESYEHVDYGLDADKAQEEWERIGKEKAQIAKDVIIHMLATLDAMKSAEEFVNTNFNTRLDSITSPFLADVEAMIQAKFKDILLSDMNFGHEQMMALFYKYVGKSGAAKMVNPVEALDRWLTQNEKESNPYGAIGITRSYEKK